MVNETEIVVNHNSESNSLENIVTIDDPINDNISMDKAFDNSHLLVLSDLYKETRL